MPVAEVAARDCILLLWATNPKLAEALSVMAAWGFTYTTMATWVKMNRAAAPRVGIGFHLRGATEHLLIGKRGSPRLPQTAPLSVIFNPIGEHSAKPDAQYVIAEGYQGPYLELFHRPREGRLFPPREGWTFLGNEVDGRDIHDSLQSIRETMPNGAVSALARAMQAAAPAKRPPDPPTASPGPLGGLFAEPDERPSCVRPQNDRKVPPGPWLKPIGTPPTVGSAVAWVGQDGAALTGRVKSAKPLVVSVETINGRRVQRGIALQFGSEGPEMKETE